VHRATDRRVKLKLEVAWRSGSPRIAHRSAEKLITIYLIYSFGYCSEMILGGPRPDRVNQP